MKTQKQVSPSELLAVCGDWPVDLLKERVLATRGQRLLNRKAETTLYPLRGIRYWWAHCLLLRLSNQFPGGMTIADVGCSEGYLKRFVGDLPNATWIGLDWRADEALLRGHGYEEAHSCDFDAPLPLPDDSVDVATFFHVVEHLPRPSHTLAELARVLRPGGWLLAGSPVAPRWVAWMRERKLRSEWGAGERRDGKHINSMCCGRWRELLASAGLRTESLTGAFLMRWSGGPLENHAWWLRLNLAWGRLVPSLGSELYVAASKPDSRKGNESI